MRSIKLSATLRWTATGVIFLLALCCAAFAQGHSLADSDPVNSAVAVGSLSATTTVPPEAPSPHSFWDRENLTLFGAVAALSAADFTVTRTNLANGGKELDPVARLFGRSIAGLVANFAGETAGVVGLSYFLHKTGHHKLERLTSVINISASTTAVTYDVAHR